MGIERGTRKTLGVIVSFLRLSHAEQRALLPLVAVAAVVEVLVRTRPLPRVARLLGVMFIEGEPELPAAPPLALTDLERRRLRCVRRIVRHWPFCRGTCLRQSLLAGHVLRRRRPRLIVGVDRSDGVFAAHAWLDVEGRIIGDPGLFRRLG